MILRGLIYVATGWLGLAAVGGLGHVLGLSLALPSVTAVVLTHLALSRAGGLVSGLVIALALGYLADLHQGGIVGALALAHVLVLPLARWGADRVSVLGPWTRGLAAASVAVALDSATWMILMVIADPAGLARESLARAVVDLPWQWLSTALLAHPLFFAMGAMLRMFGIDGAKKSSRAGSARHS